MPKDVTWAGLPKHQFEFPVTRPSSTHGPLLWKVQLWVEAVGCGEACGPRPAEGPGHQPFLAPEFLISINIYFLPPLPGSQHRGASGRLDWACV